MADNNISAFKAQYQPAADAAGKQLGVSPDVLLAQWGLETGWGKSVIPGTNNLGNIKDLTGSGVAATDNATGSKDKYRAYDSPEAFGQDFASLIQRKYPEAVGTGDNAAQFATALKAGGYAEDPNYVNKVSAAFTHITGAPAGTATPVAGRPAPAAIPHGSPATAAASWGQLSGQVPAENAQNSAASWSDYPDSVLGQAPAPTVKAQFTPLENAAKLQAQTFEARAGGTTDDIVKAGKAAESIAPQMAAQLAQTTADSHVMDLDVAPGIASLAKSSDKNVANVVEQNNVTFGEKWAAHTRLSGTIQAISDIMESSHVQPDPNFHWANDPSRLAGYTQEEQATLMASGVYGDEGWANAEGKIRRDRADQKTLASGNQITTAITGLGAGLTDAPSMVAFMGIGKAAQLARVGASVYAAAGRPVAAVISSGIEGAVGGMLLDSTLAAAGNHYTVNDFAGSTAMNLGMGLGFGLLHVRPATLAASRAILQEQTNEIARREAALWKQAEQNVGTAAGTEAIQKEADRIQVAQMQDAHDVAVSPVPANRKFEEPNVMLAEIERHGDDSMEVSISRPPRQSPAAGTATGTPGTAAVSTEAPLRPDFSDTMLAPVPADRKLIPENVLERPGMAPEVLAAWEKRYGVENIPDAGERAVAGMFYEQAERINGATTLDLKRVSKLTQAVGMESTSQQLLTSKNPLAQAIGIILTENGAGIGGRGQTAALSRHINYKQFVGEFHTQYDSAYHLWSRERGGSVWNDYTSGSKRDAFNREVAVAIENKLQGVEAEVHPAVAAALQANEDRMTIMRQAMQKVGTVGAARLGDTSEAYLTRTVRADVVRTMSNEKKSAVVQILRDQFMELNGYDREFATEHAKRYLDLANTRALGGVDMPLAIHDERAAGIVMDSLKAMNIPDDAINKLMGKWSRGGANFTKGRAELNLNTVYRIGDEEFKLMDIVDTNVPRLMNRYAQRAAGEVALTQFGVQGRNGLATLRQALGHGPEGMAISHSEMEAFDQIAAEFLGTPFGNRVKAVDNAVAATSILRLGGMGITQSLESFNGIGALGMGRTLQSITGIPRLIREASMQAKGGGPKNPIIGSIERIGGEIGMEHYRTAIPFAQDDTIRRAAGMDTLTTLDRIIKGGVNVQAKLSFHQAIMTGQVRGMAEQIVHKAMRFMSEGKMHDAALQDMGFTPQVLKALKADLPEIAKFEGGRLVSLDLTKATDKQAAAAFVQAVNRGAAQIIQGTFIGETGKWAHSSYLKMMTQFRTFGLISVEKQWNRQAGVHGAAAAMGYMLAAMSVAIPVQAARVYAASVGMDRAKADEYRDKQLSPFALIKSSMNYISALGMMPDFIDAISVPLGLDQSDVRGGGGGNVGRLVPALGLGNDVLKAAKGVSSWSPLNNQTAQNPIDTFKNITPFGRLPYLIPLVNMLGVK